MKSEKVLAPTREGPRHTGHFATTHLPELIEQAGNGIAGSVNESAGRTSLWLDGKECTIADYGAGRLDSLEVRRSCSTYVLDVAWDSFIDRFFGPNCWRQYRAAFEIYQRSVPSGAASCPSERITKMRRALQATVERHLRYALKDGYRETRRHHHQPLPHIEDVLPSTVLTPLEEITLNSDIEAQGLIDAVAAEKRRNASELRDAVAALNDKVEPFVQMIGEQLVEGTYRPAQVAKRFGLSKSTMTRWAGSKWKEGTGTHIPDLFRNVALAIASSRAWRELAEDAGVLSEVLRAAGIDTPVDQQGGTA